MNTTDTFTIDELLQALSGTQDDGAAHDAVRMADLIQATGRSELSLTRDIRRLIEAGKVECVKVPYTRIDGTRIRVPAYRVKHDTASTGVSE